MSCTSSRRGRLLGTQAGVTSPYDAPGDARGLIRAPGGRTTPGRAAAASGTASSEVLRTRSAPSTAPLTGCHEARRARVGGPSFTRGLTFRGTSCMMTVRWLLDVQDKTYFRAGRLVIPTLDVGTIATKRPALCF